MASELKPCPFCAKPLTVRNGVNPYGRCDTEGCWMAEAKIGISCDDPKQVERWNTRPAPAATDTGLVTVAHRAKFKSESSRQWRYYPTPDKGFDPDKYEEQALVTRSQAEELLAAERAKLAKEEADHTRSLEERDRYHDAADELAQAIADRYESDIGEHSSINDPWQNALNLIEADNAAKDKLLKEANHV